MFESEFLLAKPERTLSLDTRAGNRIDNTVEPDPASHDLVKYELLRKRYGARWIPRRSAAAYNCYGMALAFRRTSILDDTQLPRIFEEDRLRITEEIEAKPGDLVFYKDDTIGYIHAGVIVRRVRGKSVPDAIWALSKWGSTMGEDEHDIRDHVWGDKGLNLQLEFRTDRQ